MDSRQAAGDDLRLPVISRRAVLGLGASAALTCGLGPRGSASGGQPVLALGFFRNATGFYRSAASARAVSQDLAFYSLAIAIELSLKAHLLHVGVSDDWNRVHIGHDLRLALGCSRRAGFHKEPEGLSVLVADLTPLYKRYGFGREPGVSEVSVPLQAACELTHGLLCGVADQIGRQAMRPMRLALGAAHD